VAPGLFHDQETKILRAGSFDHANKEKRWRAFLALDSALAGEFRYGDERAKALNLELRSQTVFTADEELPGSTEVLGLIAGYSCEASSDVYRVAVFVATRLASKHLELIRTSKSIAKAMQTQRTCRAWGHSFARGFG
jgi:hypothetical protein